GKPLLHRQVMAILGCILTQRQRETHPVTFRGSAMQPAGERTQTLLDGFLRAMVEDPGDDSHALILADWLEEQDDPRAELVRVHRALLNAADGPQRPTLEARLQALLAAGVRPCVPLLVNSVGMTLAWIPPGTFLMGSPDDEGGRDIDEGPLHPVT